MRRKYKVLYIVSTLESSGPINILYNIIKYINRTLFDITIMTLSPEKENSLITDFKKLGVSIVPLNISRIKGSITGGSHLTKQVSIFQPDIIHTHGYRSDIFSSKYLRDYNRCSTIHNYPYYDFVMSYGKIMGTIMAFTQVKAFRKINKAIACSLTIKEQLLKHKLNASVVQNGVDENLFQKISIKDKQILRKELNLPVEKKIFISVGHLNKRKDPITLIKGFLNLSFKGKGILLILGDGPLLEECKNIAKDSHEIKFIGHVKNVKDYLNSADYFISASHAEGLPNSVLEALASGLPVCLSNIPSHMEMLSINNNAGNSFKLGNEFDLAEKLKSLLKNDSELLSKNAIEIIDTKLNARQMSTEYQNIYIKMIEDDKHSISSI